MPTVNEYELNWNPVALVPSTGILKVLSNIELFLIKS